MPIYVLIYTCTLFCTVVQRNPTGRLMQVGCLVSVAKTVLCLIQYIGILGPLIWTKFDIWYTKNLYPELIYYILFRYFERLFSIYLLFENSILNDHKITNSYCSVFTLALN
jgi:hypothetical protein